METLIFNFESSEQLVSKIAAGAGLKEGRFEFRRFPDGESYIRILTPVAGMKVIIVAGLNQPDGKMVSLIFLANTLRSLGVAEIGLVTPYLPYMRQDALFKSGEGVSAQYFAQLLSNHFSWLMTLDPHLHRIKNLNDIYSVPTSVLHVIEPIVQWIAAHVKKPLLIGPDSESIQWVKTIADQLDAPMMILMKERLGDRQVKISLPDVAGYYECKPILLDDIISSAHTMIEAVKVVKAVGLPAPICLGIHAIFAQDAYAALSAMHPHKIVTCNTILHPTNEIDVSGMIVSALLQ